MVTLTMSQAAGKNAGDAQQLYNSPDINNGLNRREDPIKFLQINLQHVRAAVAQSIQYVLDNSIDIIIGQEPYTRNGAAVGFPIQWTSVSKTKPGTSGQGDNSLLQS
ncbi:hypothetical protein X975_01958, partial [Stegodyphus mimosarum]